YAPIAVTSAAVSARNATNSATSASISALATSAAASDGLAATYSSMAVTSGPYFVGYAARLLFASVIEFFPLATRARSLAMSAAHLSRPVLISLKVITHLLYSLGG